MTDVITTAICTRNRAEWTAMALESLLRQDLPTHQLDVLVVDNGSTDDTAAVVAAAAAGHAHVRYELVTEPGLSRARNRAVEVALGEVVAFLDDDAVAVPGWASRHLEAFRADPTVVATGGRIDLVWPDGRPPWLPTAREGLYAGLDLGDEPHGLPAPAIPYGANMAFRKGALGAEPFALDLGRQGGGLLSGEERDLIERLRRQGGRIVYLPDAAVAHHVLPDRANRSWLLKRSYEQGRSTVAMDVRRRQGMPPRSRAYWLGRTGWQSGDALRHAVVYGVKSVARRPAPDRMWSASLAAQAAGTARQSLRALRDRTATG